jgi:hypothetical protein
LNQEASFSTPTPLGLFQQGSLLFPLFVSVGVEAPQDQELALPFPMALEADQEPVAV